MDPVTLAAITAVASVATGVLGYSAAQYQGQVAKMNTKVAEENAQRALERSKIEAQDNDLQTSLLLGEQVAAQGASGISLTSKSFMKTREATRLLGRRDTLNIIQGGEIEAYNYKVDKENFKAQASAAKLQGYGALLEGAVGATTAFAGVKPSLVGGSKSSKALTRFAVQGNYRGGKLYG